MSTRTRFTTILIARNVFFIQSFLYNPSFYIQLTLCICWLLTIVLSNSQAQVRLKFQQL